MFCAYVDVGVRPPKKPKELLEAPAQWVVLLAHPQVPFPEECGAITGCLEAVRDRRFLEREAELPMLYSQVEFVAEPLRVTTRQESGARWAASRDRSRMRP